MQFLFINPCILSHVFCNANNSFIGSNTSYLVGCRRYIMTYLDVLWDMCNIQEAYGASVYVYYTHTHTHECY